MVRTGPFQVGLDAQAGQDLLRVHQPLEGDLDGGVDRDGLRLVVRRDRFDDRRPDRCEGHVAGVALAVADQILDPGCDVNLEGGRKRQLLRRREYQDVALPVFGAGHERGDGEGRLGRVVPDFLAEDDVDGREREGEPSVGGGLAQLDLKAGGNPIDGGRVVDDRDHEGKAGDRRQDSEKSTALQPTHSVLNFHRAGR
jgi:hypothetical protein